MRFSWTGLILAPLLVPAIISTVMLSLMQASNPLFAFLFLIFPSCLVSYGATIFLFLPSLYLLSARRPMTAFKVCLLGFVLGAVVIVPLTVMAWASSGPDSGPPTENLVVFFLRWDSDPTMAMFPLAGLATAGLYWWLGTWRSGRPMPSQE